MQQYREEVAAKRSSRKLLKGWQYVRRVLIPGKLRSYNVANEIILGRLRGALVPKSRKRLRYGFMLLLSN